MRVLMQGEPFSWFWLLVVLMGIGLVVAVLYYAAASVVALRFLIVSPLRAQSLQPLDAEPSISAADQKSISLDLQREGALYRAILVFAIKELQVQASGVHPLQIKRIGIERRNRYNAAHARAVDAHLLTPKQMAREQQIREKEAQLEQLRSEHPT